MKEEPGSWWDFDSPLLDKLVALGGIANHDQATTQALGEEGDDPSWAWDAEVTSLAIGEEGDGQTNTTDALGEEGDDPIWHEPTGGTIPIDPGDGSGYLPIDPGDGSGERPDHGGCWDYPPIDPDPGDGSVYPTIDPGDGAGL